MNVPAEPAVIAAVDKVRVLPSVAVRFRFLFSVMPPLKVAFAPKAPRVSVPFPAVAAAVTTIGLATVTAPVPRTDMLAPALFASPSVRTAPAALLKPAALLVATVPCETVRPPVNVLAAFRASCPAPVLINLLPVRLLLMTPV